MTDREHDPQRRPTSGELRAALALLPTARRRALVAAVRSGSPAPEHDDAVLAIALARRAQRNAQVGWLLFPIGGLAMIALGFVGAAGVVVASVIGAYLSTLLLTRAVRAERLNRGLLVAGPSIDGATPRDRRGPSRDWPASDGGRLPIRRRPSGGRPRRPAE